MYWFNFSSKKRPDAQGFAPKRKSQELPQAFILEPILTPSGLLDGTDNPIDPVDIDVLSDQVADIDIPEIEEGFGDISDNDLEEIAFITSVEGEETLEEIPFVTSLDDVTESEATDEALTEETPLNESPLTGLYSSSPRFESGVFTVGQTGEVSVDFLFDGGGHEGELAVFSLEGMEEFEPGSEAFIQEAASRALSDSELGHIVISDQTEGARFVGELGESDRNSGEYLGVKTVQMRPGDEFGFMLVPNSTVQQVFDNPDVGGAARPLFSMATANPDDGFHVGQIADVTGDGSTFVMEDLRVDTKSDGDYNDVIFQVRGATGEAALMDEVIDSGKDWRETDLGQALIDYTEPYITPDTPDDDGLLTDELVGESPTDEIVVDESEIVTEPTTEESTDVATDEPVNTSEIVTEPTTEESTDVVIDEPVNNSEIVTEPTTASELAEPVQYEFPPENQPLVGIIDTGFSENNPDIDYSRISLGQDRIDGDNNPLMEAGEGNEHGTHVLGIIGATQDNDIGVEGINDDAPIWIGRAVGSGKWAESLVEFVDAAQESGQPNAVITINPNLTEIYEDGTVGVRYELTDAEWEALAYANKHNILVVVPAGENGELISALGQTSLSFDNIITVGTAQRINDATSAWQSHGAASNSPSGFALNILADGTNDETSTTAVSAGKVAGAASQVWAANPKLSHREVIDILQNTATDLNAPGWDFETGSGLLNIAAAVHLAKATKSLDVDVPIRWLKFEKSKQPLIGVIDTGFNGSNPDIDYSRVTLGRDHVDGDDNPLFEGDEGNEHGTHVLGIIAATQDNGIGVDGINDQAPLWLGRAVGSGKWAESLREFVDAAKASGQPNAVVNLSFDLTQTNPDGTVTTRYELTPQEREAIEYARQNGLLVVVAAGNDGGTMSALGQASQEFDNLITVGSVDHRGKRADYSNLGYGLDMVARGGTTYNPATSTVGEGTDLKTFLEDTGDEAEAEDEMSVDLQAVFEEEFGEFYDPNDSEDDSLPEDWTDEDRQAYEEATKAIDEALADYEEESLQKVGMEFISDYLGIGVEASEEFLKVFDEDAIDSLIEAEEILGNVLENGEPTLKAGLEFSSLSDLDINEDEVDEELIAELMGLDFSIDSDLDMGIGEMAGTSVAAAKVTGAVSKVWAANSDLSYKQVKEILKATAVDLGPKGWDKETGYGLVDIAAAVALAKETQPEAYTPQSILSPLTWSGEGTVIPGERPVRVTVPRFTGRVMNAGYVIQTGWLRVRSGPSTGFPQVRLVYPGNAIQFDAYDNNGGWVPDPYLGGGSSRWYRIAGTNHWVSALYIDNTPERAEEERKRQEAIRKAQEEARRAEAEARRLEEEARRAEEELRRLEEEARRQAEEEARRRAAQLAAAIAQWAPKVGALGTPLGSFISNGVAVYKFARGTLKIQPDGWSGFYEVGKPIVKTPYGVLKQLPKAGKIIGNIQNPKTFSTYLAGLHIATAAGFYPANKLDDTAMAAIRTRDFFVNGKGKNLTKGMRGVGTGVGKWLDTPVWKIGGKTALKRGAVIDLGFIAADLTLGDDKTKRRAATKGTAMVLAGAIGAGVGSLGFGVGAAPVAAGAVFAASTIMDLAYLGFDITGNGDVLDNALANVWRPVENGISSVQSSISDALKAVREKAAAARDKAQKAVQVAKATVKAATTKVAQAKAAYNTFKQQTKQAVSNLVQQSTQKFKASLQQAKQAVAQRVDQAAPRVVKKVAQYAQKAVNTVRNVVNGAKRIVNNVINKGKQLVNNVINKGKQAIQTAKNFVNNAVNKAGKAAANVYNRAAKGVKNAKNAISGVTKRLKFW
ncbi:MAG: S8 family serine peptidase [Coleofasciculus sp. G1-WW12-02]|uniref:S8 family serine peptidase n=1 Tax=Coleofasciculus sp. G1-WW12-02 TaxID=3068483 RepID=UPI0032F388A5